MNSHLVRYGVMLAYALVTLGCRDTTPPTAGTKTPSAALVVANAHVADDSAWNTWIADVAISKQNVDASRRMVGKSLHAVTYHVERTIDSSGHWRTAMTFPSRSRSFVPSGGAVFEPERFEVARIEDDGDGSPQRLFNGRGEQLEPSAIVPELRRLLPPDPTAGREPASPASRIAGGLPDGSGSSPRAWVHASILVPDAAAERRAALVREFGTGEAMGDSLLKFVREWSGHRRELVVDARLVAPVQISEFHDGRRAMDLTFTYHSNSDGSTVQSGMRAELFHDVAGGSSVVETRFSNVRLERRN